MATTDTDLYIDMLYGNYKRRVVKVQLIKSLFNTLVLLELLSKRTDPDTFLLRVMREK